MLDRRLLLPPMLLSFACLAGCLSFKPVPLRDDAFPRDAVRVGDSVRAQTRAGESLSFKVTNVENGVITGDDGERVQGGDLASLEVGRMSKRTTYITLGVVGGVLGTIWLVDELEDCDTGLVCEWEYQ